MVQNADAVRRARLVAELQKERAICDAAAAAIAFAKAVVADQRAALARNRQVQKRCRTRMTALRIELRSLGGAR